MVDPHPGVQYARNTNKRELPWSDRRLDAADRKDAWMMSRFSSDHVLLYSEAYDVHEAFDTEPAGDGDDPVDAENPGSAGPGEEAGEGAAEDQEQRTEPAEADSIGEKLD